jgi:hypothetical protein
MACTIPLLAAAGCAMLAPPKQVPETAAEQQARADKWKPGPVRIDAWQDENGTATHATYFTVLNRCNKDIDIKVSHKLQDGKYFNLSDQHKQIFVKTAGWTRRDPRRPIEQFVSQYGSSQDGPRTTMVWWKLLKGGEWTEGKELDFGRTYRLQVDADCKTISERTDSDAVYACYQWQYVGKCGGAKRHDSSAAPQGCQEGTYSVEGGMDKPCTFQSSEGDCRVYYDGFGGGCDIR